MRFQIAIASGFRFDLKTLSSDVRKYGDGDGKLRSGACRPVGPDYRPALPLSFLSAADAAVAGANSC